MSNIKVVPALDPTPVPWLPYDVLYRRFADTEREVASRGLVVADARGKVWHAGALDSLYAAAAAHDEAYRAWLAGVAARKAATS